MVDWLKKGAELVQSYREQFNSIDGGVTLKREAFETTGVPARSANTSDEIDDGFGGIIRQDSRDFIIATSDYVIDGDEVEPYRGDKIVEPDGSEWEVMSDAGSSPWRWHDTSNLSRRIRTKQVKVIV